MKRILFFLLIATGLQAQTYRPGILDSINLKANQSALVDTAAALRADIGSGGHSPVTLSGTPDYITLSGQDIIRDSINLASDVKGILSQANFDTTGLTGGGGSTDTTSLSNRINLKADQQALIDTAAAIRGDFPVVDTTSLSNRINLRATQSALVDTAAAIRSDFPIVPAEVNNLSAAVTWANVPNANITQGSVTQHQAALSITESQISDLAHIDTTSLSNRINLKASQQALVDTASAIRGDFPSETNDLSSIVTWANVPDVNITETSVTQHEGALSITESQISDLGSYLTSEIDGSITNELQDLSFNSDSLLISDGTSVAKSDLINSAAISDSLVSLAIDISTVVPLLSDSTVSYVTPHQNRELRVMLLADTTNNSTTLATVGGLSRNVEAGKRYAYKALIQIDNIPAGGFAASIDGSCTYTKFVSAGYPTERYNISFGDYSVYATTADANMKVYLIEGSITVNAAGTIGVSFGAADADGGTVTLEAGSYFEIIPMN